jgi:hypothetical protein
VSLCDQDSAGGPPKAFLGHRESVGRGAAVVTYDEHVCGGRGADEDIDRLACRCIAVRGERPSADAEFVVDDVALFSERRLHSGQRSRLATARGVTQVGREDEQLAAEAAGGVVRHTQGASSRRCVDNTDDDSGTPSRGFDSAAHVAPDLRT